MNREMRIRERAYQLWKDEGCPDGKEGEHWEKARRMIESEEPSSVKQARGAKPPVKRSRSRGGSASFIDSVPHAPGANGETSGPRAPKPPSSSTP